MFKSIKIVYLYVTTPDNKGSLSRHFSMEKPKSSNTLLTLRNESFVKLSETRIVKRARKDFYYQVSFHRGNKPYSFTITKVEVVGTQISNSRNINIPIAVRANSIVLFFLIKKNQLILMIIPKPDIITWLVFLPLQNHQVLWHHLLSRKYSTI
jgi:hypothetical protein